MATTAQERFQEGLKRSRHLRMMQILYMMPLAFKTSTFAKGAMDLHGISGGTAQHYLRDLEDWGHIKKMKGHGGHPGQEAVYQKISTGVPTTPTPEVEKVPEEAITPDTSAVLVPNKFILSGNIEIGTKIRLTIPFRVVLTDFQTF